MKKCLAILTVLMGLGVRAHAGTVTQEQGAVFISSIVTVSASTTPVIGLSTQVFVTASGVISSTRVPQIMPGRLNIEYFNDTSTEVWLGGPNVSTQAGTNYGRRLPPGTAWAMDGSVQNYFIMAATTTEKKVVITQSK